MSDEKFDQDLQSVLLADAPRDVPDELRRRVASVPMTHPVAIRRTWSHPVPLWFGGLAAAAILLAIGIWRFAPSSSPGVGGTPSSSPVEPSTAPSVIAAVLPSPTTSPTVTASGVVNPCTSDDLAGHILGWQGAAGSRVASVAVTNTSGRTCFVRGTPGLRLIDESGRVLIDSVRRGPSGQPRVAPTDTTFEVPPGDLVRTDVAASNYCGPDPRLPIDIGLLLPSNGGLVLATPGPGVSSDEAVPPCMGSTPSEIAMNGWRK